MNKDNSGGDAHALTVFGIMSRAFEVIRQGDAKGVMVSTWLWVHLNGQDVAAQATEAL